MIHVGDGNYDIDQAAETAGMSVPIFRMFGPKPDGRWPDGDEQFWHPKTVTAYKARRESRRWRKGRHRVATWLRRSAS